MLTRRRVIVVVVRPKSAKPSRGLVVGLIVVLAEPAEAPAAERHDRGLR